MARPAERRYDAFVPNKTIYVSDGDLPIYQRAQELGGGNLSSAIASALRRYVDIEEGKTEGFDEVIVRVGIKPGRKVRFSGVLIAQWANTTNSRGEIWRAYRSRKGKFVVHSDRTPEFTMVDAEGKPAGWRGHLGLGNVSYGEKPAESTIEIFDTVEQMRDKVPPQLYDIISRSAQQPVVEDLDI